MVWHSVNGSECNLNLLVYFDSIEKYKYRDGIQVLASIEISLQQKELLDIIRKKSKEIWHNDLIK